MIEITKNVERGGIGLMSRTFTYTVKAIMGEGAVNFRMGRLWRPDNRYPGDWALRRHESGGVEITFNGTTNRSKPIIKIIDHQDVDKFILSLLEVRKEV